ncbi:MAG: glutaminase [Planctomycetaceae bacterium]|nr:glutaminase [Planctomycetaceae bacterium]
MARIALGCMRDCGGKWRVAACAAMVLVCAGGKVHGAVESSEVPATPLVACDPYFSIWSTGKQLTDVDTTHWTGKPHRLTALATIDGQCVRLMGAEPDDVPALKQIGSSITPTQTAYEFAGHGIDLTLTFTTPALPYDVDILARPITYLSFDAKSTDGQEHDVKIYFEASAELAVNTPDQLVVGEVVRPDGLTSLKIGSRDQPVLEAAGDDLRIDWGYFYAAAPDAESSQFALAPSGDLRSSFINSQRLPAAEAMKPVAAADLSGAIVQDCSVAAGESSNCWLVLAYDDLESIEFMGTALKPYWRRNGLDAMGLLEQAFRDRESLTAACGEFDQQLTADLTQAGGDDYAAIGTLAYRQCFAAGKFVADANGQPIQFCKENHSNGCIATSDVFYPMSPQFLLFGPALAKSFVVPFMEYAASDRWTFPFAPHDLGTYPKANGQVYGGGERSEENQMPVEESGNMLILMAAIAKIDGNADFAGRYWPQLEQWAAYLKNEGFDPANQLCTDDFAGHLAHNVNLSAKAICGLAAFAQLCELRGEDRLAEEYRRTAEEFAKRWVTEADDGDHFRLAFDKSGTWSQKYNLVWDGILGLNLFPESVVQKEMAYYLRVQNKYGLPLDNRSTYTKLDWVLWTAALTEDASDFAAVVAPVRQFLRDTPDRSPMTDWYFTDSGRKRGFTARPVVGGVFLRLLYDDAVWEQWSSRNVTETGDYAPMPTPPHYEVVVPAADSQASIWRFTTDKPENNWFEPGYDDSGWREGRSGFGTPSTPGARIGTRWNTSDIWIRRTFDSETEVDDSLRLHIHHDEEADVYLNGVLIRHIQGYSGDYEQYNLRPEALRAFKKGKNVLAVHCQQTTGGQYIDAGFSKLVKETP